MEALETSFAERVPEGAAFTATADELAIAEGRFEHLLRSEAPREWRRIPLSWTMALNVLTGEKEPVPRELVHSCYLHPPLAGDGIFALTTTGLACHTCVREAFFHGLFECIERDAIARAFETHGFFDRYRIRLTASIGPEVDHLLDIASAAGIDVAFWQAPSPVRIAVVWCQTIEARHGQPILALPTEGYAASCTLEGAMHTALLEALATRAGAISGAREDQTRGHYNARPGSEVVELSRKLIRRTPPAVAPDQFEHASEKELDELVRRAAESSIGPVLCVPLGGDMEAGVECVRVILAGARAFAVVR
jgi:YcaO-like protein with predicted kinase domain